MRDGIKNRTGELKSSVSNSRHLISEKMTPWNESEYDTKTLTD